MASSNEITSQFVYFNELNSDLKMIVADKVNDAKDFIRLLASGVPLGLSSKDVEKRLHYFQRESYKKLIYVLSTFTQECLQLETKFMTDDNLRSRHFDLFFNGYTETGLLADDGHLQKYNATFNDMLFDLASIRVPNSEFYSSYDICHVYAETMNTLRFKPQSEDLKNSAKRVLFKRLEDDVIEHTLNVEFESGIDIHITISIDHRSDEDDHIEIDASFYDKNRNKKYKKRFIIKSDSVTNDPYQWIVSFATTLRKRMSKNHILGNIKNISYVYIGEQFWVDAYMLLDVLPKLQNYS
jgi:hypothetical protein